MTACLRFIGIINASIWFGAAVLMTFFIAPAAFSTPMFNLFGGATTTTAHIYAGEVVTILFDRYYLLQYCCGGIATVHLLAEWIITGRPVHKLTVYIVLGMFGLSLLGGLLFQPKLHELQRIRYGLVQARPAERTYAAKWFASWHGTAETVNLLVCLGLLYYTWRVANPPSTTRFASTTKFRS